MYYSMEECCLRNFIFHFLSKPHSCANSLLHIIRFCPVLCECHLLLPAAECWTILLRARGRAHTLAGRVGAAECWENIEIISVACLSFWRGEVGVLRSSVTDGKPADSDWQYCRVKQKRPNFIFFKIGFTTNWDTLQFSINFIEIPICLSCSVAFLRPFQFSHLR